MIKLDIVNAIVQKTNITRTKAEQAVETVFEAMKNALGRGQRIELRRFGVFNVKPRKTGIGRNPRTGQQVSIPPGKAVRFKPGKELQALPATNPASGEAPDDSARGRCAPDISMAIPGTCAAAHPILHDRMSARI